MVWLHPNTQILKFQHYLKTGMPKFYQIKFEGLLLPIRLIYLQNAPIGNEGPKVIPMNPISFSWVTFH
jgi:hypothetical protein